MKKKKVLIASSEAVPFAKTGGLADVVGALPKALERLNVDVSIVIPKYGFISGEKFGLKLVTDVFNVFMAGEDVAVKVWKTVIPNSNVTAYFIDSEKYFNRMGIYQENGQDYPDNDERFALFSKAVLEMLKILNLKPDIIHCNDWQTGLIPTYLKVIYGGDEFYRGIATVMTIHNIAYQGVFPHYTMEKIGLPWSIFNPDGIEFWGHVSYLKGGLVYADILNTVSKTYAKEIQTSEEFGRGLQGLLAYRSQDLYGIVNGVDYTVWNPETDKHLQSNYSAKDLRGKSRNKKALQKEQELQVVNVPLIGMISRLDDQKGFDLVASAIEEIMSMDVQMVILGTGDPKYHELLTEIAKKYPSQTGINLRFDDPLAHKIYAGCDIFLMPSRFEPCGLGQLIALKYGTLPIVHKTGGLADTITDYTENPDEGNGFVFDKYTPEALIDALRRALDLYSNKRKWNSIAKRAMTQDFSWDNSAHQYVELYERAMEKMIVTT